MVQVDIFWSYGIGAGLAVAAHRQLAKEQDASPSAAENLFRSPFFCKALLFLALVFVPSGFWLLWQFSSWETMHAGSRDLPVWLVGLFSVTNISQGVLGFYFGRLLIRGGRLYTAWLNSMAPYFAMFFVLVHGWDGQGYQRFFSPDRAAFENWSWQTAAGWFTSDIAYTLYGMGCILIPILGGMTVAWMRQGLRSEGKQVAALAIFSGFLASILVYALGLAVLCSLALIQLGAFYGSFFSLILLTILTQKRWGPGLWFYRWSTAEAASLISDSLPQNPSSVRFPQYARDE